MPLCAPPSIQHGSSGWCSLHMAYIRRASSIDTSSSSVPQHLEAVREPPKGATERARTARQPTQQDNATYGMMAGKDDVALGQQAKLLGGVGECGRRVGADAPLRRLGAGSVAVAGILIGEDVDGELSALRSPVVAHVAEVFGVRVRDQQRERVATGDVESRDARVSRIQPDGLLLRSSASFEIRRAAEMQTTSTRAASSATPPTAMPATAPTPSGAGSAVGGANGGGAGGGGQEGDGRKGGTEGGGGYAGGVAGGLGAAGGRCENSYWVHSLGPAVSNAATSYQMASTRSCKTRSGAQLDCRHHLDSAHCFILRHLPTTASSCRTSKPTYTLRVAQTPPPSQLARQYVSSSPSIAFAGRPLLARGCIG
eukprot:scaffold5308_cov70-Phaeocystis_antarctica.AAC.12